MYWQAPSFSIIRLSILISRATAKLVSDLDPSLRAAIDHLSLVRALWHKRTKNCQWLWAVCQPQQRNDFILHAGSGTRNGGDRNQITGACSHCLLMLVGGSWVDPWQKQISYLSSQTSAHQTWSCIIPSTAPCAPALSLLASDGGVLSFNWWKPAKTQESVLLAITPECKYVHMALIQCLA